MHSVRVAVSFLLLAGCVEREPLPPKKRDPWPAPATAAPEPRVLAPGLQLVSVPDAVTHDVSASMLIVVHADGTVVSLPRKDVGALTPDVLAAATPTEPTVIGQRGHVYLAQSETLAARATVASCVAGGVKTIELPAPTDGKTSKAQQIIDYAPAGG